MARAKKKKNNYLKWFIAGSVIAAVVFVGFLAYLWMQTREPDFVQYKEFGIPIPSNYEIHGIDVSRYQQRITWKAVKAMQVSDIKIGFAFIKATEGNSNKDPFFKRNWKNAKDAGMIRGAYHFFIASKDGKKQAQNFIKTVSLERGDLPPVLDVETTNGASASTIRKEVKKWLDVLEEYYKVKPIIYTNVSFYKRYFEGHLDDYPLWVAHYLQPRQPRIGRNWVFWQHSESGRVNGITSKVDFNVFKGDSTAFNSLLIP